MSVPRVLNGCTWPDDWESERQNPDVLVRAGLDVARSVLQDQYASRGALLIHVRRVSARGQLADRQGARSVPSQRSARR